MAQKKLPDIIGSVVICHWDDAHSQGRVFGHDSNMHMAELRSYGLVSHVDDRRICLRQEEDESKDAGSDSDKMKEPVQIPLGCVTRLVVLRPADEIVLRAFEPLPRSSDSSTDGGVSWKCSSQTSVHSHTRKKRSRSQSATSARESASARGHGRRTSKTSPRNRKRK